MWTRRGSLLLTMASLVLLGFWLIARVYNAYDIIGLAPRFGYQCIVAIALISPIALILTLLARPRLALNNGRPAVNMGLAGVAFLWVWMALPLSIMLGL